MMFDVARLLTSGEGQRLIDTIKRLVASQGLPIDQVIGQSVDHMERIERLALRSGRTVKEVADTALDLYERQNVPRGRS